MTPSYFFKSDIDFLLLFLFSAKADSFFTSLVYTLLKRLSISCSHLDFSFSLIEERLERLKVVSEIIATLTHT